jgi:hypothetical protein
LDEVDQATESNTTPPGDRRVAANSEMVRTNRRGCTSPTRLSDTDAFVIIDAGEVVRAGDRADLRAPPCAACSPV